MQAGCRTQAGGCSELFGTSLGGCCTSPEPQSSYSLHWKRVGCTRGGWVGNDSMRLNPSLSWPVVSARARGWGYQLPQMLCLSSKNVWLSRPVSTVGLEVSRCSCWVFSLTEVPQSVLAPMCLPSPASAWTLHWRVSLRLSDSECESIVSKVEHIQKERLRQNGLIR